MAKVGDDSPEEFPSSCTETDSIFICLVAVRILHFLLFDLRHLDLRNSELISREFSFLFRFWLGLEC